METQRRTRRVCTLTQPNVKDYEIQPWTSHRHPVRTSAGRQAGLNLDKVMSSAITDRLFQHVADTVTSRKTVDSNVMQLDLAAGRVSEGPTFKQLAHSEGNTELRRYAIATCIIQSLVASLRLK